MINTNEDHTTPPGEFSTWRLKTAGLCFKCCRAIIKNDYYKVELVYEKTGPDKVHVNSHVDCREVRERTRLSYPFPADLQIKTKGVSFSKERKMSNENSTATEETTTKRSSKKSSAKKTSAKSGKAAKSVKKTKAPAAAANEGTGSMSATAAERITAVTKLAPEFAKTLKKMASGETVTNKQYVALRDAVREKAAELREGGKNKAASQLSAANGLVRRLERASR